MLITGVSLSAHDLVRIKQKMEIANEHENPTPADVELLHKVEVLTKALGEEEEACSECDGCTCNHP